MARQKRLWGISLGAAMAVGVGCNLALGLDASEYEDAAVQVCGCTGIDLVFSTCTSRVHDALENASPEERERWLSTFDAQGCSTCGKAVFVCLQTPPVCLPAGAECSGLLDCCGSLTGAGYCYGGRCVAEAANCKHTFEPCASDADCCGSESGLGACVDNDGTLQCFEACSNELGHGNCPGCCTNVETPAVEALLCIDGPYAASVFESITAGTEVCESACVIGIDESCPEGTTCQRVETDPPGAFLHYCK